MAVIPKRWRFLVKLLLAGSICMYALTTLKGNLKIFKRRKRVAVPRPHTPIVDPNDDYDHLIQHYLPTDYREQGQKSFIVYDCSRARKQGGHCGGWSDRLSGILSTFLISLITKQRFLINFDDPCPLRDYLVPGYIEWQYNESIVTNRTSEYRDYFKYKSFELREYMSGQKNFNTLFTRDVTFINLNWDYTEEFRKRPLIGNEIPWITKLHYADIYKQLYGLLFKPSKQLSDAIASLKRKRDKMACAHVRVGGNSNMPRDGRGRARQPLPLLWKFMDKLDMNTYDIFVATDSDKIKEAVKTRYPDNYFETPGRITHIDMPTQVDPCEGFLKQFLDFYSLASCDILIVAKSGFSINAAYLRNSSSGLYCWREGDIRPCSRYTIHDTFPYEILAPKVKPIRPIIRNKYGNPVTS